MRKVTTNKMEILSQDNVEEFFEILLITTFVSIGNKYGMVEVRFIIKEGAASYSTKIYEAKVGMLSTIKGRRSVRIRIGNILPEIKSESLVADDLTITAEDPESISIGKIN